nr:hypothetical protein [uncultured Dysosmobacter sp.]
MTVTFYDKQKLRRLHVSGVAKLTGSMKVDGRPGGYRGPAYVCADTAGQHVTFSGDRYTVEMVEEEK